MFISMYSAFLMPVHVGWISSSIRATHELQHTPHIHDGRHVAQIRAQRSSSKTVCFLVLFINIDYIFLSGCYQINQLIALVIYNYNLINSLSPSITFLRIFVFLNLRRIFHAQFDSLRFSCVGFGWLCWTNCMNVLYRFTLPPFV